MSVLDFFRVTPPSPVPAHPSSTSSVSPTTVSGGGGTDTVVDDVDALEEIPVAEDSDDGKGKNSFLDKSSLSFTVGAASGGLLVVLGRTFLPGVDTKWIALGVSLLFGAIILAIEFSKNKDAYKGWAAVVSVGLAILNSLILTAALLGLDAVATANAPAGE